MALRSQAEIPEADDGTNFVITEGPEVAKSTAPKPEDEAKFGSAAEIPEIAPDQPKARMLQVLEPVPMSLSRATDRRRLRSRPPPNSAGDRGAARLPDQRWEF